MNDYNDLREEYRRRMNSGEKNVFIFPFVAIILIIIGVFILNRTNKFMSTAKSTTAKVYTERNTSVIDESRPDYYKSYAEYYVNGVKYYEPINTTKTSISIGPFKYTKTKNGEEIIIYYNPDNPREIMEKSNNIFGYVFIGFGVLIIIALLGRLISKGNNNVGTNKGEGIQEKVLDVFNDSTLNRIENVQNAINISLNGIFKIIAIIVGFLIILFGIFSLNTDSSASKKFIGTTATVNKVEQTEERDTNNKRYINTHIYVSYKVDNKTYNGKLDNVAEYKKNDQITIYYNQDNPNDIRISKNTNNSGVVIVLFGISIIVIGIIKKQKITKDNRDYSSNKIDFYN